MRYFLCNKDNEVLKFREADYNGIIYYEEIQRIGKLPYGFSDINYWLEARQAAKHRRHILSLMQDLNCDKLSGFIKLLHCTSINDTFWVREEHEAINWKDVSLYRNEFDEVLSEAVMQQVGHVTELSSTTPEFGTEGMYSKCCKRIDDKLYLFKSGSNTHKIEPELEARASKVYTVVTAGSSVTYELTTLHGKQVSKCKIFTNEEIGFVPAYQFIGQNKTLPKLVNFYKSERLNEMLVADAICMNVDRHNGNHGVLVNNDTLEVIGMAPMFDFNRSYIFGDIPKIGDDFIQVARTMLTPMIRKRLLSYEFDGFEKSRVEMILKE